MMLATMESSSTKTDVQTPELVLRAQAGDVDAFTDIVTRYHRRIVGYIVGLVVDRHMADEIAQEVFLTAHQSLETFDHRSSFVTWLIGIARNKSISALRRQNARRHREAIAGQQIIRHWELECAEASRSNQLDQIDALQLCIENLKPKHRMSDLGFSRDQIYNPSEFQEMKTGFSPSDLGFTSSKNSIFGDIGANRMLRDAQFTMRNPLMSRSEFMSNPTELVGSRPSFFGSNIDMNKFGIKKESESDATTPSQSSFGRWGNGADLIGL